MSEVKEFVKGDKYVLQSGSVMVKVVNYGASDGRQSWSQQEAEELVREFAEFEEVMAGPSCQEPAPKAEQQQAGLNYFAPKKVLKELLRGRWFRELRTSDEYDEQWTDRLIDALMASEWRDQIASDWAGQGRRSKANKTKGCVVGLLIDNGVLRGSYDSVAGKVSATDNARTFARYMGEGKRQVYARWFAEAVKEA